MADKKITRAGSTYTDPRTGKQITRRAHDATVHAADTPPGTDPADLKALGDPYDSTDDGLGYRTCGNCQHFYAKPGSDYCSNCLLTHETWAPDAGCGDLGCTHSHEAPTVTHDATDVVDGITHTNPDGTQVQIAHTATVDPTCYIGPNAKVLNHAHVLDGARLEGDAVVGGECRISGPKTVVRDAVVTDRASVHQSTVTSGARVDGDASVVASNVSGKNTVVSNHAIVDTATLDDGVWVGDRAFVHQAKITEGAEVGGDARVLNGSTVTRFARISGRSSLTDTTVDRGVVDGGDLHRTLVENHGSVRCDANGATPLLMRCRVFGQGQVVGEVRAHDSDVAGAVRGRSTVHQSVVTSGVAVVSSRVHGAHLSTDSVDDPLTVRFAEVRGLTVTGHGRIERRITGTGQVTWPPT